MEGSVGGKGEHGSRLLRPGCRELAGGRGCRRPPPSRSMSSSGPTVAPEADGGGRGRGGEGGGPAAATAVVHELHNVMTLQIRHCWPVLRLQDAEVGLRFAPCCHLYFADESPTTMSRTPSRRLHMLPLPLLALHRPAARSGGSGPRIDGGEADSGSCEGAPCAGCWRSSPGEVRHNRGETGKRSPGTGVGPQVWEGGPKELEHGRARCLRWLLEHGRTRCLRRWLEHIRSKRKLKMWTRTVLQMDVWTWMCGHGSFSDISIYSINRVLSTV
jgi:hypothetical protein